MLDMVTSKDPVTGDEVTHYLVKWRALSYEESTWELQQDVDPRKVQLFKDLRVPPPEEERQVRAVQHCFAHLFCSHLFLCLFSIFSSCV